MQRADAAYARARAADAEGEPEAAAAGYAQALAAAPDDEVVAIRAYRQALEIGDHALAARAAAVLEGTLAAPPDLPLYRYALALAAGDGAQADTALTTLETGAFEFLVPVLRAWLVQERGGDSLAVLEATPPSVLGRRYAAEHGALLSIARGNLIEAHGALRMLLAGSDAAQDLRIDAALLLAATGERRAARAILSGEGPEYRALRRQLARGVPSAAAFGASRLYLRLAADLAREETLPLSIVLTRSALLLDPRDDRARLFLADALSREGSADLALGVLGEVAQDGPYARDARIVAVSVLGRAERIDAALAAARALAEERGASVEDARSYADLLAAHERYAAAAEAYDVAIRRAGETPNWLLHMARGRALEQSGQWEAGLAELRRAVALGPDQPVALEALGDAQARRGENLTEALAMLRRAKTLRPDDPGITDALGWAHYRAGDYARAVPLLEEAARSGPDESLFNEHLGDAYWQVGRRYEARYAWRAAALYAEEDAAARIAEKLRVGLRVAAD